MSEPTRASATPLYERYRWGGLPDEDKPFAAMSWRHGGVSREPYATLNVGLHVGDASDAVLENRRRLLYECGIPPDRLVLAEQIHGTRVGRVGVQDGGRGVHDLATAIPATDALITESRGLGLGVCVADCAPVFLYDPERPAIGLVHAGRAGVYAGIVRATLREMADAFDTRAEKCAAIIGPAISVCCYEVGANIAAAFRRRYGQDVTQGRHLDLPAAITRDLIECGIRAHRILKTGWCTACHTDRFFSHRAEGGTTGRMLSLLIL